MVEEVRSLSYVDSSGATNTIYSRAPEALAVLVNRVTMLLQADGYNPDGKAIPVTEKTLQELAVLRDLIHELR